MTMTTPILRIPQFLSPSPSCDGDTPVSPSHPNPCSPVCMEFSPWASISAGSDVTTASRHHLYPGERSMEGARHVTAQPARVRTTTPQAGYRPVCDALPALTVAAAQPLRSYTPQEGGAMPRITPITTRLAHLVMDVYEGAYTRLSADGVLCERDQEVLLSIRRLGAKAERIDMSRRIARTIEDAGELTPHAIRMGRELERDLGDVVDFTDYREARNANTPA